MNAREYTSTPNRKEMARLKFIRQKTMQMQYRYAFPVYDLRKSRAICTPQYQEFLYSQKEALKQEVCDLYKVSADLVEIVNDVGKQEEVLKKTKIVILPGTACIVLFVEMFQSSEQIDADVICAHFPLQSRVVELKQILKKTYNHKGLSLCHIGHVLDELQVLEDCHVNNFDTIQAFQFGSKKLTFSIQTNSNAEHIFSQTVDMMLSVGMVKERLIAEHQDDIRKLKECPDDILHFCFQNQLLQDSLCIGLVMKGSIDKKIVMHFASADAICLSLTYRHTDDSKPKSKQLIVSKDCSTAFLRKKVAKLVRIDPKAVKLVINDKLMEECPHLNTIYTNIWQNGLCLKAGIKKFKTLRIKHPFENEEKAFEIYMLETVSALRKKVADAWGLNVLHISLICRKERMKDGRLLQYYPVKNNMELTLELLIHRIELHVMIIFCNKSKTVLVIDEIATTTVSDVLEFCASMYQYPVSCSRAILKDRCLNKNMTLAQECLVLGDKVIIVYFDQPVRLHGDLIEFYEVSPDGLAMPRHGIISLGILFHGPTKVPLNYTMASKKSSSQIPQGICIQDKPLEDRQLENIDLQKTLPERENKPKLKRIHYNLDKKRLLEKYLQKARKMKGQSKVIDHNMADQSVGKETIKDVTPDGRPFFYLPGNSPYLISAVQNVKVDSDTDIKSLDIKVPKQTQFKHCARSKNEFASVGVVTNRKPECVRSLDEDSAINISDINNSPSKGYSCCNITQDKEHCICNVCVRTCKDHSNSSSKQTRRKATLQKHFACLMSTHNNRCDKTCVSREFSDFTWHPEICEGSDCSGVEDSDVSNNKIMSKEVVISDPENHCRQIVHYQSNRFSDAPDSPDSDKMNQNLHKIKSVQPCPCLHCRSLHYVRCAKRHAFSEGQTESPHIQHFHHAATFPVMDIAHFCPNSDINTGDINTTLLFEIGQNVGIKWKQLVRKLQLAEVDIDEIDNKFKENLHEASYQALIAWKRTYGAVATRQKLINALADIGMTSVAEQYTGYHTA